MSPRAWLALCVLSLGTTAWADSPADEHLLRGAQSFRAERYSEALVEFRVAERLGAGGGARYYVAASLARLGRPEEALEAFATADETAPQERDALLDYYRAIACYDARLYTCADRLLVSVVERSGPRVAAMAAKVRGDLASLLSSAPPTTAIDWYLVRGDEAAKASRPRLAVLYFEEAAGVSRKRSDRYRLSEAEARLAEVQRTTAASTQARPTPPRKSERRR